MQSDDTGCVEQSTTSDVPEWLRALADGALVPPPRPDPDVRADPGAFELLDELAADSARVERVLERARGDRPRRSVAPRDYEAALERAAGRLALFSWGSGGVHIYGWCGAREGPGTPDRPADVWRWDHVAELRGEPPVTVAALARADLRDELDHADPTVVLRERTCLPPHNASLF